MIIERERERVIPINLNKYINSLSIESTNTNDIFTYINKNRVSKYYSLEAMRLDIEKDINMLNNINVYSMEENVFSKFWEWVKKIWKKIIDFFKMLWQKIKNFFKGKRGEQVQKKAQTLNLKAQSVKTFDPEEFESLYDNMNQENPSNVSMSDDYKDYNDKNLNVAKFKKIIKTGFPVIENQKPIENMAVPINYLLEEFYNEYYKDKDGMKLTPSQALHFDWKGILTGKVNPYDIFDKTVQPGNYNYSKGFDLHIGHIDDLKRDELFFYLIYDSNKLGKKDLEFDPREIRIYDFFNKNDALIKFFINFMATTNLEKNCDKYDTSFLEKEIKKQQEAFKICLDNLQKTESDLKAKGQAEITMTTRESDSIPASAYYKQILQRILRQISQFMGHYQDAIMMKCQMIYLFEEIINKIA